MTRKIKRYLDTLTEAQAAADALVTPEIKREMLERHLPRIMEWYEKRTSERLIFPCLLTNVPYIINLDGERIPVFAQCIFTRREIRGMVGKR